MGQHTRPDSVFLVGLVVLVWFFSRKWRTAATNSIVAVMLYLPWAIYALVAFGDLVPASLRAKMTTTCGPSGYVNLATGLKVYTPGYSTIVVVFLVSLAVIGGCLLVKKERRLLPFVLWVPVYYIALWTGRAPDFIWYYAPPLWVVALVWAKVCSSVLGKNGSGSRIALVLIIIVLTGFMVGQAVVIRFAFEHNNYLFFHKDMAQALGKIVQPGDTVAAVEVGNLAYWTNCQVLDMLALTLPEAQSWARGGHYDGFLRHYRPKFVVIHGYKDLAQLQTNYRVVWERRYWTKNMYRIWERQDSEYNRSKDESP